MELFKDYYLDRIFVCLSFLGEHFIPQKFYLRAIAHAADPLWESKVGVAFGMVNLDTHGPTKNQNDRFNFL